MVRALNDPAPRAAQPTSPTRDTAFLWRLALLYGGVTLVMLFTLDPFWAANWDVQIITDATRSLWDGGSPFDLYEQSRAKWPWPFPYPPHAALLLVPFIGLADLLVGSSVDYGPLVLIAIRVPPLLAEVAIAALLHRILSRLTGERWIARLGAALWLFNPVLFYHTAVQGHQESTWMLPVLLAFERLQWRGLADTGIVNLLLVVAISLKQSAAIYAMPYLAWLLVARRWRALAGFSALFALIFGLVSLPWWLYSPDFQALVFEEVRRMPVQVQSWQLWALAVEPFRLSQTETTFPTIRLATPLILLAAAAIGTWMRRAGRSWYAIGLAATLCFFLVSQKVMGYHYPMVLPWLILFALGAQRFRLLTAGLIGLVWILFSPYFAPWADPAHLTAYALLGTINSLAFLWLLVEAIRGRETPRQGPIQAAESVQWTALLALCVVVATVAQPLRAPLATALAAQEPMLRVAAFLLLMALLALLILLLLRPLLNRALRALAVPHSVAAVPRWRPALLLGLLIFLPLSFTWLTMTAELTAVLENGIVEAWGSGIGD